MNKDTGIENIIDIGKDVIEKEIEGLRGLFERIGEEFEKAVELILSCRGKVIVCGIGKSGIVARKIAATMSSTGTPAVYLHPAEAVHGDMGMITADDVVIIVSKSGNNDEIGKLFPYLKSMGVQIVAITSNGDSSLAHESDIVLDTGVTKEACPMDIVPTTSTTASMVLGDALAVAVFRSRDFKREDFARLHPSGVLGKRLSLKVSELMHSGDEVPLVSTGTTLREALFEIINKRQIITIARSNHNYIQTFRKFNSINSNTNIPIGLFRTTGKNLQVFHFYFKSLLA